MDPGEMTAPLLLMTKLAPTWRKNRNDLRAEPEAFWARQIPGCLRSFLVGVVVRRRGTKFRDNLMIHTTALPCRRSRQA
jgi:hypothetical protein